MALLFSPISEALLEGPFRPFPRSAFLMLHSGSKVAPIEREMDSLTVKRLGRLKHPVKKAARQPGTKDYLEKIIQIIRGCGFGVAIFSENTPAPTLANIFFEIGLCGVLGKPVILVKSERAKPPSDFVRTEWITFKNGETDKFRKDLDHSIQSVRDLGTYYEELGDLAFEAEDADLELAFERYRQAILIADRQVVRNKVNKILTALDDKAKPAHQLEASRGRLRTSIREFRKLLPH
jgi:hypothetical protein